MFLVALVLLGVFVAFRLFEEKRGVRLWAPVRTAVDEKVIEMYHSSVTGSIPRHYRLQFLMFLRQTTHAGVLLLVAGLRALERPLTRLSYRMRMATSNTSKKEVSSFLKTIAPEKPQMSSGNGGEKEKSV